MLIKNLFLVSATSDHAKLGKAEPCFLGALYYLTIYLLIANHQSKERNDTVSVNSRSSNPLGTHFQTLTLSDSNTFSFHNLKQGGTGEQ